MEVYMIIVDTKYGAAPGPRPSGKKRKMTGPKKRYTAAVNSDYMCTVLFGK
jgi:hypothetical protein